MGLNASVTGYSQDGGVDLVAENLDPVFSGKYVVQCKAQGKPVGEPIIRDLFGTMHAMGANKGILITTSSFTAAALRFAQGKPLELIDGEKYCQLCDQYGIPAFGQQDVETDTSLSDELLKPGSNKVRIKAIDCTDAKQRKELQEYVFCIGTLKIGNEIILSNGRTVTTFYEYQVKECERNAHFGNGLDELKITFEHPIYNPETFSLTVEGQPEVIEQIHRGVRFGSPPGKSSTAQSGCLVLFLLQIAFVFVCLLLIFHLF